MKRRDLFKLLSGTALSRVFGVQVEKPDTLTYEDVQRNIQDLCRIASDEEMAGCMSWLDDELVPCTAEQQAVAPGEAEAAEAIGYNCPTCGATKEERVMLEAFKSKSSLENTISKELLPPRVAYPVCSLIYGCHDDCEQIKRWEQGEDVAIGTLECARDRLKGG